MLAGKVVVVTGSAGGIGRAAAIEFARAGAKVVVSDVDHDGGAETAKLAGEAGGEAQYIGCDVRDGEQIQALMDGAAERFGGIDVLHNNAGVHDTYFGQDTAIDTLDEEIWDRVYEINLKGVWLCTKHAAGYLRRSSAGAIVNAASIGGLVGYPMGPAYCATKGGVIQLTKVTAIDLASDGVRCNCYCPAAVDTYMVSRYFDSAEDRGAIEKALTGSHLVPRLGEPEEVAKLVLFLADAEQSSFINGAAFVIDGGSLAWLGIRPDAM